jgi:hypothetical protein
MNRPTVMAWNCKMKLILIRRVVKRAREELKAIIGLSMSKFLLRYLTKAIDKQCFRLHCRLQDAWLAILLSREEFLTSNDESTTRLSAMMHDEWQKRVRNHHLCNFSTHNL